MKVGQRVTVDPNSGCHKCIDCHVGNYHYCGVGGLRNTIGIYQNGGWATHVLVPESQVYLYSAIIIFISNLSILSILICTYLIIMTLRYT